MDEIQLQRLINKCAHLKHKFRGIYAANQIPLRLAPNTFIIANASNSSSPGTHWTFLGNIKNKLIFADPLGYTMKDYSNIYKRLDGIQVQEWSKNLQMQPMDSNLCGLYCIYIAHMVYNSTNTFMQTIDPIQLTRFANHFL